MAITVTVIQGNGQMVPANLGQNSLNIIVQVLNGGAPVAGVGVTFACTKVGFGSVTPPIGYPGSNVTDASGKLTFQFLPPAMLASDFPTQEYDFTATYSGVSGAFIESAYYVSPTQIPGVYASMVSPASATMAPYKAQAGVAGTPLKVQVFDSWGRGVANIGCKPIPHPDGGGGTQQVITVAEATGPEGLVFTNSFGIAIMTPTFASPNTALGGYPSAPETFEINVGGLTKLSPFDFLITSTAPAPTPQPVPTVPKLINRTGWVITADSVLSSSYPATNAIDGDPTTYWNSAVNYPHYLIVDMGSAQYIDGVQFTTIGGNQTPGHVEVYVSDDGVTWGTAVGTFTWVGGSSKRVVTFPGVTKRWFKFNGVDGANLNGYMGCAELNAGSGFTPVNGGHGPMTSATLVAWTSYSTGGNPSAGNGSLRYTATLATQGSSDSANLQLPAGDYALRSDSFNNQSTTPFLLTDISQLVAWLYPAGTLYVDPCNAQMLIYNCYVKFTCADGFTGYGVPTGYAISLYGGSNGQNLPNGEINWPTRAYDLDSDPPTTYAQIITRRFAPLGSFNILELNNWVVYGAAPPFPGGVTPGYTVPPPATGTAFGNVAY